MNFEQNKEFLKRIPLFCSLKEEQIDMIARASQRKSFLKSRKIVMEGQDSQFLFILLTGRAKVQKSDAEGKEVILCVLKSGDLFGEMGIIDSDPHSASIITIDPCEFISIQKKNFLELLSQSNETCMLLMKNLVERLRRADKKIQALALLDVYGRVATVLLDIADEVQGERIIHSKITRHEIAKMVGASREMVSRVMKNLQKDGYIIPLGGGKLLLSKKISIYLS